MDRHPPTSILFTNKFTHRLKSFFRLLSFGFLGLFTVISFGYGQSISDSPIIIYPILAGEKATPTTDRLLIEKAVYKKIILLAESITDNREDITLYLNNQGLTHVSPQTKQQAYVYGYEDPTVLALTACANRYFYVQDALIRQHKGTNLDVFIPLQNFVRSPHFRQAWLNLKDKKMFAGRSLYLAIDREIQQFKGDAFASWVEKNPDKHPADFYIFTVPQMHSFLGKINLAFDLPKNIPADNTLKNWSNLYKDLFFATMLTLPEDQRMDFKIPYEFFQAHTLDQYANTFPTFLRALAQWKFDRNVLVLKEQLKNLQQVHLPIYVFVEAGQKYELEKALKNQKIEFIEITPQEIAEKWAPKITKDNKPIPPLLAQSTQTQSQTQFLKNLNSLSSKPEKPVSLFSKKGSSSFLTTSLASNRFDFEASASNKATSTSEPSTPNTPPAPLNVALATTPEPTAALKSSDPTVTPPAPSSKEETAPETNKQQSPPLLAAFTPTPSAQPSTPHSSSQAPIAKTTPAVPQDNSLEKANPAIAQNLITSPNSSPSSTPNSILAKSTSAPSHNSSSSTSTSITSPTNAAIKSQPLVAQSSPPKPFQQTSTAAHSSLPSLPKTAPSSPTTSSSPVVLATSIPPSLADRLLPSSSSLSSRSSPSTSSTPSTTRPLPQITIASPTVQPTSPQVSSKQVSADLPMGYAVTANSPTPKKKKIRGQSNTFTVKIDTSAPADPVIQAIIPDTGSSCKNGFVNSNRITLVGSAEPNSTVTVYQNKVIIGTAQANTSGSWSFVDPHTLEDGQTYSLKAIATDAAGNNSPAFYENSDEEETEDLPDTWMSGASDNPSKHSGSAWVDLSKEEHHAFTLQDDSDPNSYSRQDPVHDFRDNQNNEYVQFRAASR